MGYIYSLGNILILLSLCFRKVLFIRAIFVLSDLSFMLYGILADAIPILYWAVASLLINLVQIVLIFRDMMPKELTPEMRKIKHLFFYSMQTSDFLRLIKLSYRGTASNQKILIKDNPVENLMLLISGQVFIEVNEGTIKLEPYHFIGEMSYFSDGKANSTIYAQEPVDYLYWRYTDLHDLQVKSPPLFMKMIEAMGKDIMLKMLQKNEAKTHNK